MSRARWLSLLLLGVALVSPFFIYPVFLMKLYSFVLFALAFYFLYSTTYLLSFGHAAFFALGSYGAGLLVRDAGWTAELSLVAAIALGLGAGYVVGILSAKRQGIYFSMITLAFAQLFYFFILKTPQSGGEDGLQGVPRSDLLSHLGWGSDLGFSYFVLVIVLACFAGLRYLQSSPLGLLLRAMKSNDVRAEGLGYNVYRARVHVFAVSAALASLAGALKTLSVGIASLVDAHWHLSGEVVLANLLGGLGNPWGPLLGSVVVMSLQEYLAAWGAWISICLGLIYVGVLLFLPGGLTSFGQKKNQSR